MKPGQEASDRPDIVARVFDEKRKHLIETIVKKKLFGEIIAHVEVIEYQKRGLPHIHFIGTLNRFYKLNTAEKVNNYISAEIPDPNVYSKLHDIVMKQMIHGPCGERCKINGKCSKRFPKGFHDETTIDDNNYPTYRRRNTGLSYERSPGHSVDNRDVVPYSPILLLIYDCHINVEVVLSVKSVKYLYKYLHKGHDSAAITVERPIAENTDQNNIINHDEIKDFIESRYVGPVEGYWRITSKKMKDKSHAVIRLPVHLPNEQTICLESNTDNNIEDALTSATNQVTMLLDYFELNQRDEEAKQYTYINIPRHYVFKKTKTDGITTSRWERRKSRFNIIGRMYSISPSQSELFHLRILLLHRKGA